MFNQNQINFLASYLHNLYPISSIEIRIKKLNSINDNPQALYEYLEGTKSSDPLFDLLLNAIDYNNRNN